MVAELCCLTFGTWADKPGPQAEPTGDWHDWGWNRDQSGSWWDNHQAEADQHWDWQQEVWQQESWTENTGQAEDPWAGWSGVHSWVEAHPVPEPSAPPRSRSPRHRSEPAASSAGRPAKPRGKPWWERPPPEWVWDESNQRWKRKNQQGKRSPEKVEERIQRGQERRAASSSAKVARVEPPQEAETSTEPGSESSSSSSVSTIDYESGSLPVQTEAAASAAAERIRAIKLEGDPGEPEGPHAPSAGVKSEDPNEEPLASAAAKAASELRDSWISVKEEVDYSPSDTPAHASPKMAMAGTTQLTAEEVSRQLTGLTEALRRAEEAHRGLQEQLAQSQHRTQLLEQQLLELQQAGSTAAGGTAASRAAAAAAVGSGVEDWERFVWQVETFAALVDESFPVHLEEARKSQSDNTPTEESDEYRALSVKLFGMLVSLIAECPAALKIARGTRNQNGFVLWRMLWREFHPEQANRGLIWRRALLSPKFPNKEGDFSAALQEWELDLAKYESEFGAEKAISDEDKRALLMVESPQALKQHLAMHASSLGSYDEVRAVVVSYLQAKRVWTPSGGYAQSSRRAAHDPDAMDIGKQKEKEKCPICWRTGHTVKDCWYNVKGKGKGTPKGGVNAVADDTSSQLSAGPSASQAGSAATTAKPGVRHISDEPMRVLAVRNNDPRQGHLLVDTGAAVSVCRPGTFSSKLDPKGQMALYSVDDTPLNTLGATEPVLRLGGDHRQNARTTFQVVEGITDDILSVNRAVDAGARVVFHASGSHIEWADGSRADFVRSGKQFLLPYAEMAKPSKHVTIAAVEDFPDDLEAQAVEEFAIAEEQREAEAARAEAAAAEANEGEGEERQDLEAVAPPADPEPNEESVPREPTAEEKERHRLTHLPFQSWCPECVQGAGRGGHHRRKKDAGEGALEATVQMDYTFYSRGAQQRLAPENESVLVTVLTLVDRDTGWPCSAQVPRKGQERGPFVLDAIELYLNNLGHKRVILQIDQEGALRNVAVAVRNRMGAHKVRVRESPPYSHQSQGAVEGEHHQLAGLVRTWLMDLQNRYPNCMVDVNHVVFPWLVKYVAWSAARFQVRTADKMTAYKIVNGVEYLSPICKFGETVMAKLPKPGTKAQRRWIRGIWVGRLERDNTNIILTEAGALSVRSVRRLPPDAQANRTLMGTVAGVPWALRQGRTLRQAPALQAEPLVLPAPPLMQAETEGDHVEQEGATQIPSMAHDGPEERMDKDALDVEGAAAAESLEPREDMDVFDGDTGAGVLVSPEETAEAEAIRNAAPSSPTTSDGPSAESAGAAAGSPRAPAGMAYPTGLGEGGLATKRSGAAPPAEETRPTKQPKAEAKKSQRVGKLQVQDLWKKVEEWANADDPAVAQQRLATVMEYLDSVPDPQQIQKAREEQLWKLWRLNAFTPVMRWDKPADAQTFHYKWVDKVKDGVCKSRFTCADTRRSYTPEMEQDMRVFVPTPTPEAHALLEITALQRGCTMRTFDIVAAFLIGKDRGAQNENWVYMRPPAEWKPIFDQWVREQPPSEQSKLRGQFADMLFRLDGNLYGRRTAGSVYRDELEELLCHKLSQTGRYAFKRGVKDPCIYRCMKTGIIVVHHIDDGRCAGNAALLNTFLDEDMCSHCEITTGPLEAEGVSVEVLGKTKTRLEGCILTAPDAKHARNIIEALGLKPGEKSPVPSRKPDLSDVTPLSAGDAAKYRSAVGSGIYLSADRRDIQYAVKELARHMAEPRQCDMQQARLLGKYLQQAPDLVRVTALDPSAYEGPMTLDVFSDSDWGGCVETRRSTDCHVVVLGGAIVATSTQTQPGLPATSSPDAELRGISRACREAIFVHELATMDFGLEVEIPRLWSDSSTGITAAKRIGPGTKLRHLDVSEFYVQGAVQAGKALLRKVKGTENPANFLTRHPKSENEVLQALPSLGMVDPKHVAGATAQEKHTVKFVRVNPPTSWKPVFPFKPTLAIAGITMASQILGVKAQPREKELLELVLDAILWLGLLGWFVLLYHMVKSTVRGTLAIYRRVNRHRQHEEEPEPEASEDEAPTQAAENAPPPLEDLFREGLLSQNLQRWANRQQLLPYHRNPHREISSDEHVEELDHRYPGENQGRSTMRLAEGQRMYSVTALG
ncbi:RE1 [Symbiodinium natans]|uniref:RE1 protein n=1 Tax=Symbiodinium natans TaxID=878477 RepID=A0A812KYI2_9DINO|nr:RE1 [Symbiodinium natans]